MKLSKRVMDVSPSLTLQLTAKAAKMKAEGIDVVSFGAGEPDFDTPGFIIEAGKEALDKGITRYTDASGTPDLRKAVAQKLLQTQNLKYENAQIIISNGAKHSLSNAIRATVDEGEEVLIPSPYWLTYPELVKLSGGVPKYIDTSKTGCKLTPEQISKNITAKTRAIFINNPNNPTGVVYTKDEIFALAAELEKYPEVYIISDEIYDALSYTGKVVSIATYSEKIKEQTIVINGVSKTYAMTGWRIGWSASNLQLAKAMGNLQSHSTSNPNSIAQYATVRALTDPRGEEFLVKMNQIFDTRRRFMVDLLHKMNMKIVEPMGAFYVMIDVTEFFGRVYNGREIKKAQDMAEMLIDEKFVAVVPCEAFGAPQYMRLSYATNEQNIQKGLTRIKEFFDKLR